MTTDTLQAILTLSKRYARNNGYRADVIDTALLILTLNWTMVFFLTVSGSIYYLLYENKEYESVLNYVSVLISVSGSFLFMCIFHRFMFGVLRAGWMADMSMALGDLGLITLSSKNFTWPAVRLESGDLDYVMEALAFYIHHAKKSDLMSKRKAVQLAKVCKDRKNNTPPIVY